MTETLKVSYNCCTEVSCSSLSVANANLNTTIRTYQTYVNVSCLNGYEFTNNRSWIVTQCQADSTWSTQATDCTGRPFMTCQFTRKPTSLRHSSRFETKACQNSKHKQPSCLYLLKICSRQQQHENTSEFRCAFDTEIIVQSVPVIKISWTFSANSADKYLFPRTRSHQLSLSISQLLQREIVYKNIL
jgi:hypothetical protein